MKKQLTIINMNTDLEKTERSHNKRIEGIRSRVVKIGRNKLEHLFRQPLLEPSQEAEELPTTHSRLTQSVSSKTDSQTRAGGWKVKKSSLL
jgi:hypothetical protein